MVSWTGSNWSCISDNTLTEQQVENYVTNDAVNLAENSKVDGNRILTTLDQGPSSVDLSCLDDQPQDTIK